MRFGLVTQFYDPEPGPASLPGVLARGLAARGHQVRVITGFPNYPDGRIYPGYAARRPLDQRVGGIPVRRVPLYPSHDRSAVRRAMTYGSFGVSSWRYGTRVMRGVDAVWVSNSPITNALPMWALTRNRIPAVLHVLDVWPQNVTSSGMIRPGWPTRGLVGAMQRWTDAMYRSAAHIATISPAAVELIAGRGVPSERLSYVPLWADESVFKPSHDRSARRTLGVPDGDLVVLYAGNLGTTQMLDTLVQAGDLVPPEVGVTVWLAGSGTEEDRLRDLAATVSRPGWQVRLLGRVPAGDVVRLMAAANVHYVGLRNDAAARVTAPSKVQATLASGQPLIVAVDGHVGDMVARAGAGLRAVSGDPGSVASAIVTAARMPRAALEHMGARARLLYETEFSADAGIRRVEELLVKVASNARVARWSR